MGNANGRIEVEGSSSAQEEEGQVPYGEADLMIHSPPLSPRRLLPQPLMGSPQRPVVPFSRPGEAMHLQNYSSPHRATVDQDVFWEKLSPVMITWNFDGKQVAVTGSWDNWENRELLQRTGKHFLLVKMLPSDIFHYRFIVDGHFRHAPDLPWEQDDTGATYNIMDVQEHVPETTESLAEFESPPSPESSYNNEPFYDHDFKKLPHDLPPQVEQTLLNERSSAAVSQESLPWPRASVLNHLYIQNDTRGQPIALGSTQRFLRKYVTVVLYRPSTR